jgi:hypothetical protein
MNDIDLEEYDPEELRRLVKALFAVLDTEDMSDAGVPFHPVYISSCRVEQTAKLNRILPRMRELCVNN